MSIWVWPSADYNGTGVSDNDPGHYFGKKPFTPTPGLDIEKLVNGVDADEAPGPFVPVGSLVTFTYIVTNTGNVTLSNIMVADNVLGTICTIATLAPGKSFPCTKTAAALAGTRSNIGKAAAWYGNPKAGGIKVSDSDWGHYTGQ